MLSVVSGHKESFCKQQHVCVLPEAAKIPSQSEEDMSVNIFMNEHNNYDAFERFAASQNSFLFVLFTVHPYCHRNISERSKIKKAFAFFCTDSVKRADFAPSLHKRRNLTENRKRITIVMAVVKDWARESDVGSWGHSCVRKTKEGNNFKDKEKQTKESNAKR